MPRFRKEKERIKETCNGFKLTTLYHWSIFPITQDKKHNLLRISKPVFLSCTRRKVSEKYTVLMIIPDYSLLKRIIPNICKWAKLLSCLLIKQIFATYYSYICSGHARIGTNTKERKVFASES